MNSLNPVTRVGDQFVDMMRAHEKISKSDALERAGELLDLVGIDKRRTRAYAHELSGGMRQRVIIAMALALNPELVIMDEPTTALDVVVQREILQQIKDLQAQLGFAVLFITHDLSLLFEVAHRIAIMYAGEVVEEGPAAELRDARAAPLHARPDRVVPAADGADRADDRHPRLAAGSRVPARRLPVPSTLPPLRAGAERAAHAADDGPPGAARRSGLGTGWRAISWSSRDDRPRSQGRSRSAG